MVPRCEANCPSLWHIVALVPHSIGKARTPSRRLRQHRFQKTCHYTITHYTITRQLMQWILMVLPATPPSHPPPHKEQGKDCRAGGACFRHVPPSRSRHGLQVWGGAITRWHQPMGPCKNHGSLLYNLNHQILHSSFLSHSPITRLS